MKLVILSILASLCIAQAAHSNYITIAEAVTKAVCEKQGKAFVNGYKTKAGTEVKPYCRKAREVKGKA